MLSKEEIDQRLLDLENYQKKILGSAGDRGRLNEIILGAEHEIQERLGKLESGSLLYKFMSDVKNPKDYPSDYRGLLYYDKNNLDELIRLYSNEADTDIFGRIVPEFIASESFIKENYYDPALYMFKKNYSDYVNRWNPDKEIFSSFTVCPNQLRIEYFISKKVCYRILVIEASDQNIRANNFRHEYEVFDKISEENIVEFISFEDWMTKYPDESEKFRTHLSQKNPQPTKISRALTEEGRKIQKIMDQIIESEFVKK